MTDTQGQETVEVVQADREAAAAYVAVAFGKRYAKTVLENGRWPDLTKAFARHRITSTQPVGEVDTLREALRRIADLRIASDFGFPAGGPTVAEYALAALSSRPAESERVGGEA